MSQEVAPTDDIAGNHADAATHCEDCGLMLHRDPISGTLETHLALECIARQRLELLRHIRDELRRLNIHTESIAVAGKVANAQNEDLRAFYGKVIDERRRAHNARLRAVLAGAKEVSMDAAVRVAETLGKKTAGARGERSLPKSKRVWSVTAAKLAKKNARARKLKRR